MILWDLKHFWKNRQKSWFLVYFPLPHLTEPLKYGVLSSFWGAKISPGGSWSPKRWSYNRNNIGNVFSDPKLISKHDMMMIWCLEMLQRTFVEVQKNRRFFWGGGIKKNSLFMYTILKSLVLMQFYCRNHERMEFHPFRISAVKLHQKSRFSRPSTEKSRPHLKKMKTTFSPPPKVGL